MIFPNLEVEEIVQVGDKTRFNSVKSFTTPDEAAVSLVRISPDNGTTWFDVTGTRPEDWYLDWEFATDGNQTVQVEVTTDGAPSIVSKTITVISEVDDKLFSDDDDLRVHQPDILKWVPDGRNTFKDIHRRAQQRILAYLDQRGYTDSDGARLTKASIIDLEEVKEWSIFLTLRLIMEGLSNALDDEFDKQAEIYKSKEINARHRFRLRVDINNDGTVDTAEYFHLTTARLLRR